MSDFILVFAFFFFYLATLKETYYCDIDTLSTKIMYGAYRCYTTCYIIMGYVQFDNLLLSFQ